MADERDEALREARALLALCREQTGASDEPLALLVRAVERLADAFARPPTRHGAPLNDAIVDNTTGPGGAAFDRGRPRRGYPRDR